MSRASFGKPLKGYSNLAEQLSSPLNDRIGDILSSGDINMDNLVITSGTIDGVVIGSNTPGPGTFTTLQIGGEAGQGFAACFFGDAVGDSACWEPALGRWNIQGELLVRDISDLANLRISSNTISSRNINGNIILNPDGIGRLNIFGAVQQETDSGNLSFNTLDGGYSLSVSKENITISGEKTEINTKNGDITLQTGLGITQPVISLITTGTEPVITTTSPHNLKIGDTIQLVNTNSVPSIDGEYIVNNIVSSTQFSIIPENPVITFGDSGYVYKHNDINLIATNNVNIPLDIPLTFGEDSQNIRGNSAGEIIISSSTDINLSTGEGNNINIPVDTGITFGDDNRVIKSDGTDIILDIGSQQDGKLIINGNLSVNGNTTSVNSTVTTIKDPVITLGVSSQVVQDNKDRGIEFYYNDGVSPNHKTGFFGWDQSTNCFTFINDAVNNSEVFSGNLGCLDIGELKATSIDLKNGTLTSVSSLEVCNISCSGDFLLTANNSITLTSNTVDIPNNLTVGGNFLVNGSGNHVINGNSLNLNTTDLVIQDPIITISNNNSQLQQDSGVQFSYYDSSTTSFKNGFFGWDQSTNCFTFIPNATITTDNVVSGVKGDSCFNNGDFSGDVTISGTLTVNGQNVDGSTGTGGTGTEKTKEHLNVQGGITGIDPSSNINMTFVVITSTGVSSGTLLTPSTDGFEKYILATSLVQGGSYELICPSGILVDPGSGTTASKKITFSYSGQSMYMVWDDIQKVYVIISGNACIN